MKRILALVVAFLMCLPASAITISLSEDFSKTVYAATFALYGQKDAEDGTFVRHFLCTATAVETAPDGYKLLTAGHCVTGDDLPADLKFFVAEDIVANPVLQSVTVEKAENSTKYDFAILHLKTSRVYPVISVSQDAPSVIGSVVVDVNFSEGWAKQVAMGFVSSNVMTVAGAEGDCSICQGRFMVEILAGPGASGSAIVDKNSHQIIGILEGGSSRTQIGAICIPTSSLRDFLVDSTIKIDSARDTQKPKIEKQKITVTISVEKPVDKP